MKTKHAWFILNYCLTVMELIYIVTFVMFFVSTVYGNYTSLKHKTYKTYCKTTITLYREG